MDERNGAINLTGLRSAGRRWPESSAAVILALLTVFVPLLTAGCSRGTKQKAAAEALNKVLQREAIFLPLSLGRVGKPCGDIPGFANDVEDLTALTRFRAAERAGLVTIAPDGPGFWKVEPVGLKPELMEHLKTMKHNLKESCNSVHLNFAVASKSVVAIVNLQEITGEKAEAEYTWNWALTPAGTKLVNALNAQERVQLDNDLEKSGRPFLSDPTFSLADLTESSAPHPGKKMLKRSGDSWVLDE